MSEGESDKASATSLILPSGTSNRIKASDSIIVWLPFAMEGEVCNSQSRTKNLGCVALLFLTGHGIESDVELLFDLAADARREAQVVDNLRDGVAPLANGVGKILDGVEAGELDVTDDLRRRHRFIGRL